MKSIPAKMKSYTKILSVLDDSLWQISQLLLTVMFALFSGAVQSYHIVKDKWIAYKYADNSNAIRPLTRYYLSTENIEFDESDGRVPEDCVYIEEWVDAKGHKKNVVLYEGEEIPTSWNASPFDTPAKCPWVWVGDRDTEIDLTRTFNKFLVPGNRILLDLVCNLIQVTDRTNLIYIESGTFKEIKFPGDGVIIKADVDSAEEPVSTR